MHGPGLARGLSALLALFAAAPVAAECTVSKLADLPITMEGRRPIVPAEVNGRPVRLIADSGAFFSLLSPAAAQRLQLKLGPTPPGLRLRGIGGTTSSYLTKVASFGLAGATIPNVDFLVGGSETGVDGLLGQNVLGVQDAEYDLAGGAIRLFKTADCGKASLAYWGAGKAVAVVPLIDTGRSNQHITATVLINGIRMRATLDTGAPVSSLTLSAAARAGIKPADPGTRPAGLSRGLGRNVTQSYVATFKSFAIGDEVIQNARLRFADVPGVDWDMLLGADFFLSHRIFVSNATHRMFVTYNGGPVFDLSAAPQQADAGSVPDTPPVAEAAASGPADADGFARRAAALAARRDFASALPDYDRAVALAPNEARYFYARAGVHAALRQPEKMRADLDAAIRLKPDYADALIQRAVLRLARGAEAEALADLDAAAAAAPDDGNIRLALGGLYGRANAPDRALVQYDRWVAAHGREDSHLPEALNGRCWARAMLGRELDQALADCNAAVRAAPKAAGFIDSRGLVRLRRGELDKAIADYTAALAIQPRISWSLYGRGLARRAKGLQAEADADMAAALAIDPGIARRAEQIGLRVQPAH